MTLGVYITDRTTPAVHQYGRAGDVAVLLRCQVGNEISKFLGPSKAAPPGCWKHGPGARFPGPGPFPGSGSRRCAACGRSSRTRGRRCSPVSRPAPPRRPGSWRKATAAHACNPGGDQVVDRVGRTVLARMLTILPHDCCRMWGTASRPILIKKFRAICTARSQVSSSVVTARPSGGPPELATTTSSRPKWSTARRTKILNIFQAGEVPRDRQPRRLRKRPVSPGRRHSGLQRSGCRWPDSRPSRRQRVGASPAQSLASAANDRNPVGQSQVHGFLRAGKCRYATTRRY